MIVVTKMAGFHGENECYASLTTAIKYQGHVMSVKVVSRVQLTKSNHRYLETSAA